MQKLRQLEVPGAYSYNLYYMKGKDMTLSYYLSRIKVDKSKPHEIIPISFDLQEVLKEKYIQSRSGTQKSGITVRKIHGHDKSLLPNLKPEKAAKIVPQLPSIPSTINQPQIVTNVPIRRGVGRFEKDSTRYKSITQAKSTFAISLGSKANAAFSASANSRYPEWFILDL